MFKKLLKIAAAVAISVLSVGVLAPIIGAALVSTLGAAASVVGSALAGALGGAASAAVTGGDWKKGALIGGALGGIGEAFTGVTQGAMDAKTAADAATAAAPDVGANLAEASASAAPAAPAAPAAEAVVAPASDAAQYGGISQGPTTSAITGDAAGQAITTQGPAASVGDTITRMGPVKPGMMERVDGWMKDHPWLTKAGGNLAEMGLKGLAAANTPSQAEQQIEVANDQRGFVSNSVNQMQTQLGAGQQGQLQRTSGQSVFQNGMLRRT